MNRTSNLAIALCFLLVLALPANATPPPHRQPLMMENSANPLRDPPTNSGEKSG